MKKVMNWVGILAFFCLSPKLAAQSTDGTLTVTFDQPQPTNPAPNAGIKSVLAIWIENGTGTFIKTKRRNIGPVTSDHLPTWTVKSGGTMSGNYALGTNCNVTDATTGATLTTSTSPTAFGSRSMTWDGKNVVGTTNGTTVVDGTYKVWVESTWVDSGSNNHNEINSFAFQKSNIATHTTYTGDTYLKNIVIDWVPSSLGVEDVKFQAPAVVIYPVPSTGIFNVDLKNQVNEIKVFNLLGQTIFSEKVKDSSEGVARQVDLSGFPNGSYVLSLTNEFGTSNYEIVLKK